MAVSNVGNGTTLGKQVLAGDGRQYIDLLLSIIGVLCLVGACVVGSLSYPSSFLWFFETKISFVPDLVSGLIAALALFPLWRAKFFVLRGWGQMLAIVPLFYLTAVLTNIGIGGNGWSLLKVPSVALFGLLLVLSNLNYARYAELAYGALLFLASYNVVSASESMSFLGFAFVALTIAGVVLVFDYGKLLGVVLPQRELG